jgi:hypothetical protein
MRLTRSERPAGARCRGRRWRVPAALLGGVAMAVGVTGVGLAAAPCGNAGVLSTSTSTMQTCTYTGAGEDTFTVPAGVSSLHVVAVGGLGGGREDHLGGFGAHVSADVPVQSGAVLYVEVAGNGGPANEPTASGPGTGGAGGVNGGAAGGDGGANPQGIGGFGGGGGGGATDLRTAAASAGLSPDPRLLVAGGGGGSAAGGAVGEGLGGAPGAAGTGNSHDSGGGQPGTGNHGGAGGSGEPASAGADAGGTGQPGVLGAGGVGGAGGAAIGMSPEVGDGGGGAGGGYYGAGGGGGGGGDDEDSGGGGGGSSLVAAGATNAVIGTDASGVPSLTIGYTPTLRSTSTSVLCNGSAIEVGQATTCQATVSDTAAGPVSTPTALVRFASDSPGSFGSSGSCTLVPTATTGVASCLISYTPSSVASGTHLINAQYEGDATHGLSTSTAGAPVSVVAGTTTMLQSSSNPSTVGQQTYYIATITPAPNDAGSVAFTDNGTTIPGCSARTVSDGSSACVATYAAAGSHAIQASYSGGGGFAASVSPILTQVVVASGAAAPTPTEIDLSSSENPSIPGDKVTLAATVHPVPDGGTVQFVEAGGKPVPNCAAVRVNPQTGQAGCSGPSTTGAYEFEAAYSGTGSFTGSQSQTLTQTVLRSARAAVAPATPSNASWATAQPTGGIVVATVTTAPSSDGWEVGFTENWADTLARAHVTHRSRTVSVASKRVRIPGGKMAKITIKPNATGRRLLRKLGRLRVTLTVTLIVDGRRHVVATRKLTIKRARSPTHSR